MFSVRFVVCGPIFHDNWWNGVTWAARKNPLHFEADTHINYLLKHSIVYPQNYWNVSFSTLTYCMHLLITSQNIEKCHVGTNIVYIFQY